MTGGPACIISGATLLAGLMALWIIRESWYIPWERAAVINVALQTFKIIVVLPLWDHWVSNKLHTVTRVWNLEELLAHIGYMFGMLCVLFLVTSRLDMTREEFKSFVRYRIEIPGVLAISCMIACFVAGPGRQYVPDTVTSEITPWLRAYWLVVAISLSFILVQTIEALLILRRDPRSRRAANSYLCAALISAAGIVAFQLEILWMQWLMIRVEVIAYAVAASYTWHSKRGADIPSDYLLPG